MKRIIVPVPFLMAFLFLTSAVYGKGEYYVQSVKAKVMSATSFKSPVMGEVGKGFKFTSSGKEGTWVKVKYKDKDGYVSSLLVATHPPFEKTSIIKGDEEDIKQGVRRRASSFTSAAAARGLTSDDRKRLSIEEKTDYDLLDYMESFKVTTDEINRFMEGNAP
jgi:uncharacterized protein YgiM (DUF1202 family)